jgi:hypothetical protein
LASSIGVIIGIAILLNVFGDDLNLHVGLPTSFNVIEEGQISLGSINTNVRILEAKGKINLIETPYQLRLVYGIFMIFILAITFYLFFMFRKFVTHVYKGAVFVKSNIQLLKRISYGLLAFWGFIVVYNLTQHFLIAKHLEFKTIEMTSNLEFYPFVLIIALFLWVLSHIFMHGSDLEEEANLTI